MNDRELAVTIPFGIRFSEVDSMNIVWHGSYPLYFEDAREAFGKKYDLGYMRMFKMGVYAPLVDLRFQYRKAMTYEMNPEIKITYRPTDAAKIIFDYEIRDRKDGSLLAILCRFFWTRTIIFFSSILHSMKSGKRSGCHEGLDYCR